MYVFSRVRMTLLLNVNISIFGAARGRITCPRRSAVSCDLVQSFVHSLRLLPRVTFAKFRVKMSNTPLPTFPKIIKWIFIIFNAFFAICGLILIGFGGYLVGTNYSTLGFGGNLVGAGVLLIICGLVTFALAVFGAIGGLFQLRPFLVIFAIALIILVVIEVIAAILVFAFGSSIIVVFRDLMNQYGTDNATREAIDNVQNNFNCCGASSPDDWRNTPYYRQNNEQLPPSCCSVPTNATNPCLLASSNLRRAGCTSASVFSQNVGAAVGLGVVAFLIGLMEIFGIILSFGLCICISRNKLQVV